MNKLERIQREAARPIYSKFRQTYSPSDLISANGTERMSHAGAHLDWFFLFFFQQTSSNRPDTVPDTYMDKAYATSSPRNPNTILRKYIYIKISFFPRKLEEWNSRKAPV